MNRVIKISSFEVLSAKISLTAILFFSIFTIAGYSSNSNILLHRNVKTELTYSTNAKASPNSGLYKKFLLPKFNNAHFYTWQKRDAIALLLYNRLEKVKLHTVLLNRLTCQIPNRFIQLKEVPDNSNKASLSSKG